MILKDFTIVSASPSSLLRLCLLTRIAPTGRLASMHAAAFPQWQISSAMAFHAPSVAFPCQVAFGGSGWLVSIDASRCLSCLFGLLRFSIALAD